MCDDIGYWTRELLTFAPETFERFVVDMTINAERRGRLWFRPPQTEEGRSYLGGVPPERHLSRVCSYGLARSYVA